ncbi:gamma-mobile-trio integrase GmtZ [Vibrio tubiashii]|uniref:gamma-mobile-trio integrase GmtZ n=1 Tax=Vibrio tubiashii TaxID=29498 RepID=UPI003CE466BE
MKKIYKTINHASKATIGLGIQSQSEYNQRYKEDERLPSSPSQFYASDWVDWFSFLDKEKRPWYPTYAEASDAAIGLGIQSQSEYNQRYKEDERLPSSPSQFYAADWVDWFSFLDKEKRPWHPTYAEASDAAIGLGIQSQSEYNQRYKEDERLPSTPNQFYAADWVDWFSFLDKEKRSLYQTYAEASDAAIGLGIQSQSEYNQRYKEDERLPSSPNQFYAADWVDWFSFLDKEKRPWHPTYAEASDAAIGLGIQSQSEYNQRYKEDERLPSSPSQFYAADWVDWFSFLDKEKRSLYPTYAEASDAAIGLGIQSQSEYQQRYKEDERLPSTPNQFYAADWVDWFSFLDKEKRSLYQTYAEASDAAIGLGIQSQSEYNQRYKEDERLPSHPSQFYAADWVDWFSFLDKEKQPWHPTYAEASDAAIGLGIQSQSEYNQRYKEDERLPSTPNQFYAADWVDWFSFLDKEKRPWYPTYAEASEAAIGLGIQSQLEYKQRYKEDERLPSHPSRVYAADWVNWFSFLDKEKRSLYPTYEEASDAAIGLGIQSQLEYQQRYKEDERLPSSPSRIYTTWVNWFSFLDKEKRSLYPTYAEASEAAIGLGIQSQSEYKQRYKEDERLPSTPNQFYAADWVDWFSFLDKEKRSLYPTYAEASEAAIGLGIQSQSEYQQRYKEDKRLPSSPHRVYADNWVSWTHFLMPNDISNLKQFKQACSILKISNSVEYKKVRKDYPQLPSKPEKVIRNWTNWYDALNIPRPYSYDELCALVRNNQITSLSEYAKFRVKSKDPRIPVKPEEYYKGKGWTNTYDFWGIPSPYQVKYFTEDWKLWSEKITEFLKTARGGDTKAKDLCEFVREYIEPNNLGNCPLEFLTRKSTNIQPMLELLEQVPVTRKKKWIYSINEFLDWVILKYLIVEDEETGEVAHIKGAKNPLGHVNYNGESNIQSVSETQKLALPYQYVKEGREWIFPADSMTQKLSYSDLAHLHNFSADWLLVDDGSLLDKKDPDCVWKVEDGKTYLWLPMYWTYTYSLMQLPARGMQIVYGDSGEADSEVADFKNGQVIWKKNRTRLTGLTIRQSMVSKSGKDEFGVHYTSNKTKFDGSGYTIPFMPIELAYWLIKLRKWQQKYNPIKKPTKWLDCEHTNLNETQRKQKGVNCFLFRDYREQEPGTFGGRLTSRLAAALFFSSKSDSTTATYRGLSYTETIAELKDNTQIALSRFKSPYTPHSMRVSLINAYAYEFGIPLEVIMKLVGHSSIIMTIYYTKSGKTGFNLREKMELGEKVALSKATQTLKSFVEQQRIEEVKSQLVGSSVDLLNSLDNARPASSYLWKDFGICPVGGAFCSEGGSPIATKANIYHPVPAGYLGEQNCFQCRFFITGPAFMVGLAAMFNEISLAVNTQSIRYTSLGQKLDDIAEKIDIIDHQLYKLIVDSSQKSALESDRRKLVEERMHLNSEIETRAKKLDLYLSDMNAIHRHIHNCQTLMRNPQENTESHYQLIVPHEFTLGVELDEVSNFHQLSEVCWNAELYHSCNDDLAVARRSQMIDKMMVENGIQPQFFLLSEEEQLLVGNQLTELMLTRLKGWENVDRLMGGSLTLKDLSIDNQFDEKTIRELFEQSKPLKRIG